MSTPVAMMIRVDDVAPVPWRNGGGVTRELLAWPDPADWIVRISVAEIRASGPFSDYAGVDRWFAVLAGGALRLETRGMSALELDAARAELHHFPGDAPTGCRLLGAATRDFNLMLRRARGRLRQGPLAGKPQLATSSALAAVFTLQPLEVRAGGGAVCALPGMALAWWNNPGREPLALLARDGARTRGWWIEADPLP